MVELNFYEMTDEEIQFFGEEYSKIFQRVCDDLVEKQKFLVKTIKEPVTITNMHAAP